MDSQQILSLFTNAGTIILLLYIVRCVKEIIMRWMELQHNPMASLTEQRIRGPKPILLNKEVREEITPT